MFLPVYNIAIEYNGDYFHMNPMLYSDDEYNKTIKMTANEKHVIDAARIKMLENEFGIKTIIAWEYDAKKNKQELFNRILNEIKLANE